LSSSQAGPSAQLRLDLARCARWPSARGDALDQFAMELAFDGAGHGPGASARGVLIDLREQVHEPCPDPLDPRLDRAVAVRAPKELAAASLAAFLHLTRGVTLRVAVVLQDARSIAACGRIATSRRGCRVFADEAAALAWLRE
jgi:hypothetical protein